MIMVNTPIVPFIDTDPLVVKCQGQPSEIIMRPTRAEDSTIIAPERSKLSPDEHGMKTVLLIK